MAVLSRDAQQRVWDAFMQRNRLPLTIGKRALRTVLGDLEVTLQSSLSRFGRGGLSREQVTRMAVMLLEERLRG